MNYKKIYMRYVVIIFIIIIFVFFGVLLFGRGGPKQAPVAPKNLADYATTDVRVRLTTSGVINGDDAHREIVITVGGSQRTAQIIQGYQGNVIKTESFANNDQAYSAFLSSLQYANFTKVRNSKYPSEEGLCPMGYRYVYEIINNGNEDMRTWSTSCNGSATFGGNGSVVRQLFQNQITNYDEFTNSASLN